jgi:hypothetical protein
MTPTRDKWLGLLILLAFPLALAGAAGGWRALSGFFFGVVSTILCSIFFAGD